MTTALIIAAIAVVVLLAIGLSDDGKFAQRKASAGATRMPPPVEKVSIRL